MLGGCEIRMLQSGEPRLALTLRWCSSSATTLTGNKYHNRQQLQLWGEVAYGREEQLSKGRCGALENHNEHSADNLGK